VFKIIEELGAEAQENMEKMRERLEAQKAINEALQQKLRKVANRQKCCGQSDENGHLE